MLAALPSSPGAALPVAASPVPAAAGVRSVPNEDATTRDGAAAWGAVPAGQVTGMVGADVVGLVAVAAIVVNVALTLIDVWRVATFPHRFGEYHAGIIPLAAVALLLHLRHVAFGLRGERPPAGRWTLVALAGVNVVGVVLVGRGWLLQLPSLAVSALIVVRGPGALFLVALIALTPLMLEQIPWTASRLTVGTDWLPGLYLLFTILWRSLTQYVPVRLVAAIEALQSARRSLETRAVLQARARIDAELRNGLGRALERIVTRGEFAMAAARRHTGDASDELRAIVSESRRASPRRDASSPGTARVRCAPRWTRRWRSSRRRGRWCA